MIEINGDIVLTDQTKLKDRREAIESRGLGLMHKWKQ